MAAWASWSCLVRPWHPPLQLLTLLLDLALFCQRRCTAATACRCRRNVPADLSPRPAAHALLPPSCRTRGARSTCSRAPPAAAVLQDTQRPLYMQPRDAIEYGVIDGVVTPEKQIIDEVKSREQWDKDAGLVRQQG